jgi:hypothetical protein
VPPSMGPGSAGWTPVPGTRFPAVVGPVEGIRKRRAAVPGSEHVSIDESGGSKVRFEQLAPRAQIVITQWVPISVGSASSKRSMRLGPYLFRKVTNPISRS